MHSDHQIFLEALQQRNKVELIFFSKEDGTYLTRKCAPMDFGPSRRAKVPADRYHFWDYDSDKTRHTLSLLPTQIKSIRKLDEEFEPEEFITWNVATSQWFIDRDWGTFS